MGPMRNEAKSLIRVQLETQKRTLKVSQSINEDTNNVVHEV